MSRTHTTSSAPAPALAPATIAFSATSTKIVEEIHAEDSSPYKLKHTNAWDHASLQALAKQLVPYFAGKQKALNDYLAESESGAIQVSEKTKAFWREKKAITESLLNVMSQADKPDAELDEAAKAAREEYLQIAKTTWEVTLKEALVKLNEDIIGPYALGK